MRDELGDPHELGTRGAGSPGQGERARGSPRRSARRDTGRSYDGSAFLIPYTPPPATSAVNAMNAH